MAELFLKNFSYSPLQISLLVFELLFEICLENVRLVKL